MKPEKKRLRGCHSQVLADRHRADTSPSESSGLGLVVAKPHTRCDANYKVKGTLITSYSGEALRD